MSGLEGHLLLLQPIEVTFGRLDVRLFALLAQADDFLLFVTDLLAQGSYLVSLFADVSLEFVKVFGPTDAFALEYPD